MEKSNLKKLEMAEKEGLGRLWKEFEEFIAENGGRLNLEVRLLSAASEAGVLLTDEQLKVATEGVGLFFFGNHLAMQKFPKIAELINHWTVEFQIGEERLVEDRAAVVWGFHEEGDGKLDKVSPWQVIDVTQWLESDGEPKTVSVLLSDKLVKANVLTGIEEWAHLCFWELKSLEDCLLANEEREEKVAGYREKATINEDEALRVYYGSRVERRAVLWQKTILREYLPETYLQLKELTR